MTREEEAKETLLCLYDAVDEEGIIDLHTWYKGIQDNIREVLYIAIKALDQEPCADAISRQAVLDEISDYNNDLDYTTTELYDRIKRMSSVNPQEPRAGHWIEHKHNGLDYIECSKCSTWFLRMYLTRNSYCPNCGCQMFEPHEEGEDKE